MIRVGWLSDRKCLLYAKPRQSHVGSQSVCGEFSLTVQKATLSPLTWHPRLTQRESGVLRFVARQPSCVALHYANQGRGWRSELWRLPGKVRGARRPSMQREVYDADISAQSKGRSLFVISSFFAQIASNLVTKNTILHQYYRFC